MANDEETINELLKVAEMLPPLPKKEVKIEEPYETCVCGKKVLMDVNHLEVLDTGVFKTLSDVCIGCREGKKIDMETARLVCANCKRTICRITPHRDPVSGFTFRAGKSYHLESCALCNPDPNGNSVPYKIIEVVLWNKIHKNRNNS